MSLFSYTINGHTSTKLQYIRAEMIRVSMKNQFLDADMHSADHQIKLLTEDLKKAQQAEKKYKLQMDLEPKLRKIISDLKDQKQHSILERDKGLDAYLDLYDKFKAERADFVASFRNTETQITK